MNIPSNSTAMDLAKQPQRDPKWIRPKKPVVILTGITVWTNQNKTSTNLASINEPKELIDASHGHICSSKESHIGIDNVKNFMVWNDVPVRMAENADDAHETVYLLNDPRILSHLDVGYLHDDPMRVYYWFKANISIEAAEEIARLLDTVLTNSLDHL